MALCVDLNSYDGVVRRYIAGEGDSLGWPVLDALERLLYADVIQPDTEEARLATRLLAEVRSRLGPDSEQASLDAARQKTEDEYKAALLAVAQAVKDNKLDPGLWRALIAKRFEKKMYEERLTALETRMKRR
jgi:hypothetical protein